MKLTTGYDFQGYVIVDYLDVIFDEVLVGIGLGTFVFSKLDNALSSLTGTEATEIIDKLNAVKSLVRKRVEEKAQKMGANALIGIDFESSKLGDLIMVSMTATAVKIEKLVGTAPLTVEQELVNNKRKIEEEKRKKYEDSLKNVRDSYLKEFQECTSFYQIKEIWSKLNVPDSPLKDQISSELERNIYIEKEYFTPSDSQIKDFIERLLEFLAIENG